MRKFFLSLLMTFMVIAGGVNAQSIAFVDGFESGDLDSKGWTQEAVEGNTAWQIEGIGSDLQYPATVIQGTKRAYLRNTTGETQGYVTRLISPVMRLDTVYQPFLSFWFANPKWTADRDTLRVLYKSDPKQSWKVLATFSDAHAQWRKVQLELPEYSAAYQIAFEGKDNLGRGIVLDSVIVRSTPECTVPHDITANSQGAGKVNIAWNASWDANEFELAVLKEKIDPDTIEKVPASAFAFHKNVSGSQQNYDLQLVSGEYYYVYIRSICETETSAWSSEDPEQGDFRFRVKAIKQVPYSYGFNLDYDAGNLHRDLEWTWGSNTGNFNPFINTHQNETDRALYSKDRSMCVAFTGANNMTTALAAGQYAYTATPAIVDTKNPNFALNQCQVRFWTTVYKYTGRTYAHSLIVGVMTDPEDITTFVAVDTVSVWGTSEFVENIVDLSSYQGDGQYVGFVSYFDVRNLIYLDDVTVEYKQTVNTPTQIKVNPRDTYAAISWNGNAPSYRALITTNQVDPANPKMTDVLVDTMLSTNSFVYNNLQESQTWNKPYYVYVQAINGEAKSDWSYRYPFVTIAGEQALPMNFTMEQSAGMYEINAVKYPTNIGIFSNDPEYPHLYTTNPFKGNSCLYLSKDPGNDSWITFPMVNRVQDVQITFYLSGNTTPAQVHATVGVMTNPMDISTFVPVADFANAESYIRCYASFEEYQGENGVIAIVWSDTEDGKNTNNYIDNVTIEPLATCTPPKTFNVVTDATAATVSWEAGSATQWEVVLTKKIPLSSYDQEKSLEDIAKLNEVVIVDTIEAPATGNPTIDFTKLDMVTPYYFYARAICGSETSWFSELSFKTPCPEMYPVPYEETFDNMTDADFGCWQVFDSGTGTGYPKINSASGGAQQFGSSMELWSTSTTHRNWAAAPKVDLAFDDLMLQFHVRSWSSSAKSILYVGFMSDPKDTTTFVAIDTIHVPNGTKYYQYTYELANYKAFEGQYVVFTSGMYSVLEANSDVNIDNVSFKSTRCAAPYNIKAVDTQISTADVEWEGRTDDKWEVKVLNKYARLNTKTNKIAKYDTAKVAIINDTIVENAALHIEGLKAQTKYYIYVRPTCGDSIWAVDSIKSGCVRINPNIVNKETFESWPSGTSYAANQQPDCWTSSNANPSSTTYLPYIYKSTTYASSGQNTYRLYGYSTSSSNYTPAWCATPEIACDDMSELVVTFNYYMSTTSTYALLYGVMTDPDDLTTFVVLDSIKGTGKSVQLSVDLSEFKDSIPAEARYFAWRTPYGASTTVYLDDVSVLRMKCPMAKPSYSELEANKVRINSGLRTDNDWILLITDKELEADSLNKEGFTYPDSIIVYLDTIDARSKVVTGLKEKTRYYVAVASYCDAESVPYWVTTSFITPCLAVTPEQMGTITFAESDGYVAGNGADRYLPCWTIGNLHGSTAAARTPYIYGTSGNYWHNGNRSLEFYDTASEGGAFAVTPQLNVDSIKHYQVNFWGTAWSSGQHKLIVGVVTDPTDLTTFVAIDTVTFPVSPNWEAYTISFENYDGDFLGNHGKYVMFLSDFGAANDVNITEISVEKIPSCVPVKEITVDSIGSDFAIFSWESNAPECRFLLADKDVADSVKATYDKWLVDSIVTKYDSIRIIDLEPNKNYYAYVQNICSAIDSSKISLKYARILTDCPSDKGFKAPYFTDFDSNSKTGTGNRPDCWTGEYLNHDTAAVTQSYPYIYTTASYAYSGSYSLYFYSYGTLNGSTNYRTIAVAPKMQGNLNDYMVSFYARQSSTGANYGKKMIIGYVTNTELKQIDSTFVKLGEVEIEGTAQKYYEFRLEDKATIPAGARIALKANYKEQGITPASETTSIYAHFYIDNFRIGLPPTCYAPTLEAGNTTLTTAEVRITPAPQGGSLWELAMIPDSVYKKLDDVKDYLDTVTNTVMADSLNYIVPDLQDGTTYQVFARTVCGGEDGKSAWTELPMTIITQYYFKDSYFFGFEKNEGWIRSLKSTSDNNYIHPALKVDYYTKGTDLTSSYCPYAIENTTSYSYGYGPKNGDLGKGALRFYGYKSGSTSYYGGYVVFPGITEAKARSFEFNARNAYMSLSTMKVSTTYPGHIILGTIEKGKGFETFEMVADIEMPMFTADEKLIVASESNNFLFKNYTFDFDEETMANKQIVLYQPEVDPADGASYAMTYVDNVRLGESKGYSMVSLTSITAESMTATVNWSKLGGPWNLAITHTYYDEDEDKNVTDTVATFKNLTSTSQVVEGLTPNTKYEATLTPANMPTGTNYVLTSKKSFKTFCLPVEPDAKGEFVWDFNDPADWEPSDMICANYGTTNVNDTAFHKPGCFTIGWNYSSNPTSSTINQNWMIIRKGINYTSTTATGSNYSATYAHYEYGRDDSPALKVYTSSSYNTKPYFVLPALKCDYDTMMIEFWGRCLANYDATHATPANRNKMVSASYVGASYCKSVIVGTMTDPSDFSTFEVIDTLNYTAYTSTTAAMVTSDPNGNRYWQKLQTPLSGAKGKYIAIYQPAYGLFFIDDLSIKPVGDNIFAPSHPVTVSVGADTATFSWQVKHPTLQSVVVVLGEDGETELFRDTIVGTTYTAKGLQPASIYSWYMYQTNGKANSALTTPEKFYTECVPVTPDYATGFELTDPWWIMPGQTSDTYKQTKCWTYGNAGSTVTTSYRYNYANTATVGYNHTKDGAYAPYLYASSTTYQSYIASPAMDITAYDTLQVNFWMRPGAHGLASHSTRPWQISTQYTLGSSAATAEYYYSKAIIVGTMTDPDDPSTFVPIDTVNYIGTFAVGDPANEANDYLFQKKKISLRGATGPYVAFFSTLWAKGAENKSTCDYMYLDDISFTKLQECVEPTNLTTKDVTSEGAFISWEGSELTKKYVLQVSEDLSFYYDTAFVYNDTVEATSFQLNNLKPHTTYAWRVQAICGEEYGESEFSQNALFTTIRIPFYGEDFSLTTLEAEWSFGTNPAVSIIDSVDVEFNGTSSTTYGFKRVTTNYGITGAHYTVPCYTSSNTTTTYRYYWMVSPVVYLNEKDSAQLTMDFALTAASSYTPSEAAPTEANMADDYTFMIVISDDGGKTWKKENIVGIWNNTLPAGHQLRDIPSKATSLRVDLTKYQGKNIRVAFYREAFTYLATNCAFHIGNIRINNFSQVTEEAVACQYEDIEQNGFIIDGDKVKPGAHSYSRFFIAPDSEAEKKGIHDTLFVLNAFINEAVETVIYDTICEGESYSYYDFSGKTKAGLYKRKLQGINHCDSLACLHLFVNPRAYTNLAYRICQGDTLKFADKFIGQDLCRTGVYYDTLSCVTGCDSVLILSLTVIPPAISEFSVTACETNGYYWPAVDKTYNESGDFTAVLKTVEGCDSTVTLHLTIAKVYKDSEEAEIQKGETYTFYGHEYSEAGTYEVVVPGQGGECDSTHVLILTVNTALENVASGNLKLVPNVIRTGESVTAKGQFSGTVHIEIYDIVGRLVHNEDKHATNNRIVIDAFENSGVYTVRISDNLNAQFVGRVIVQ